MDNAIVSRLHRWLWCDATTKARGECQLLLPYKSIFLIFESLFLSKFLFLLLLISHSLGQNPVFWYLRHSFWNKTKFGLGHSELEFNFIHKFTNLIFWIIKVIWQFDFFWWIQINYSNFSQLLATSTTFYSKSTTCRTIDVSLRLLDLGLLT